MVHILDQEQFDDSKLHKERKVTVYFKNIFNKQHNADMPFVRVIYIDRNGTKHLNESFTDKPSSMASVAGELMHRIFEKIGPEV